MYSFDTYWRLYVDINAAKAMDMMKPRVDQIGPTRSPSPLPVMDKIVPVILYHVEHPC